jgi:hypothetical protein
VSRVNGERIRQFCSLLGLVGICRWTLAERIHNHHVISFSKFDIRAPSQSRNGEPLGALLLGESVVEPVEDLLGLEVELNDD